MASLTTLSPQPHPWHRQPTPSSRFFVLFSLLALALASVSLFFLGEPFRRFLGPLPAPLAVVLSAVAGRPCLTYLHFRGWCADTASKTPGSLLGCGPVIAVAVATAFTAVVVPVDYLLVHFPQEINVPPPQSLLFYPVMAYMVEIALRVVPLAILLGLVESCSNRRGRRASLSPKRIRFWFCAFTVPVAAIEPILQLRLSFEAGAPHFAQIFVAVHVFFFGLAELFLFRRYGFGPMLVCRLVYYLQWHIVWGYLRLRLLF